MNRQEFALLNPKSFYSKHSRCNRCKIKYPVDQIRCSECGYPVVHKPQRRRNLVLKRIE